MKRIREKIISFPHDFLIEKTFYCKCIVKFWKYFINLMWYFEQFLCTATTTNDLCIKIIHLCIWEIRKAIAIQSWFFIIKRRSTFYRGVAKVKDKIRERKTSPMKMLKQPEIEGSKLAHVFSSQKKMMSATSSGT